MRFFFEISYKGTHYHGWQNQDNAIGVQAVVEKALTTLLRKETPIVGSGRTDTGVHCRQQFFHADVEDPVVPTELLHKLNSFLPADIAIRSILPVLPTAHARYDARLRGYEYHITTVKDPMLVGLAYYFFRPLDLAKMNQAAQLLVGNHDFQSFSKVNTDVNHFLCELKTAYWERQGDRLIFFIEANRFLRGMVRALVGTLLEVGTGKITAADFGAIIASRDRKKAGMNAPPEGLYLVKVEYKDGIFVA
ncbi:MAG: tRNA pseudouridine(38-40) synthase TruA [Cyclobacteriaceae bacterium]|jgi:tRNA pseudouridine38-40 synthase|nr:tRNA pseudouridine(38-40) synthase TruA [Cyclobacteriaceae bacterium]